MKEKSLLWESWLLWEDWLIVSQEEYNKIMSIVEKENPKRNKTFLEKLFWI